MPQNILDIIQAEVPQGFTGSKGDTGFTGSVGFTGSQGAGFDGSKGDTGFTGSQGAGFTGSKGDTGFDGSVGFTGSKGDTGFTGSQGSSAPKSISIMDPTSAEDITLFYTDVAITMTAVEAVLRGSGGQSVTLILRHATDRSAAGTGIIASTAVTNITTGQAITVTSGSIPANSFVWLETTALAGTVNELHVSVFFS